MNAQDQFKNVTFRPKPEKPLFRLASARELLKEPDPLQYLIEGYIQPESSMLLFGEPAVGKSIIAIAWSASIATGRDWHGHLVKQGAVVYIAGEGHFGISRRLKAWAIANNAELDLMSAPLVVSERGAALNTASELQNVIDAIDAGINELGEPVLIVIDTLHRNMHGDENSAEEMGEYFRGIDELRSRYKAAILTVHHSGHNESARSRGSSAIRAALDAEYRIVQKNELRTLSCTKMKDGPTPSSSHWSLEVISLPWLDVNGYPESSVVLELSEQKPSSKQKMPDSIKIALESFIMAANTSDVPNTRLSVPLDDWRPYFYQLHTGDNDDSKRKSFCRVRNVLVGERNIMEVKNDVYTIKNNGTTAYSELPAFINNKLIIRSKSGTSVKEEV